MSSQTLSKTWKSIWWIPFTKGILAIVAAVVALLWSRQTMTALVIIVGIIIGVILILHPGFSLHVIAIFMGVWLVLLGVFATSFALPLRLVTQKAWGWMFGGGISLFVLGIVILVHPGFGVVAMSWLLALGVLLYGVANLAIAVGIRKITSSISLAMRRNPHNTIIEGDVVDSPDTSAHPELK